MRRPGRSAWIAAGITAFGLVLLIWGIGRLNVTSSEDVPSGIAIAVGGLLAFFGLFVTLNFIWAVRIYRASAQGKDVIARWTVEPETMQAFLARDVGNPERNLWTPPKTLPQGGAPVIIAIDAILIEGWYHGMSRGGLEQLRVVDILPGNPLVLRLSYRDIAISDLGVSETPSQIRIPVARGAEDQLRAVLDRFDSVIQGRIFVRPKRLILVMRGSIVLGVLAALSAMVGFGYMDNQQVTSGPWGDVVLFLAIFGIIVGPVALLFAVATGFKVRAWRRSPR